MLVDKPLLLKSFKLVVACEPRFTHHFYDLLFAHHPRTKELFHRKSREVQERLLFETLSLVLERLDDADYLEEKLGPLGDAHVQYGVTPEMYDWVQDALISTLAHVLGPAWSIELDRNWREAYRRIKEAMLRTGKS